MLFLAYTIKGCGLPLAGHKDNHAGLMTPAQIAALAQARWVSARGTSGSRGRAADCRGGLERVVAAAPFFAGGPRRHFAAGRGAGALPVADNRGKSISTQMAFGQILNEIARAGGPLADRIVTTAPDVTVSTNLGAWVNRRGLYAREGWPTPSRPNASPPPTSGSSRPTASISSSASPRRT